MFSWVKAWQKLWRVYCAFSIGYQWYFYSNTLTSFSLLSPCTNFRWITADRVLQSGRIRRSKQLAKHRKAEWATSFSPQGGGVVSSGGEDYRWAWGKGSDCMGYQLPDNWELTGWELEAGELFAHSNPHPSTLRAESNDFPSRDVNQGLRAFSKPWQGGWDTQKQSPPLYPADFATQWQDTRSTKRTTKALTHTFHGVQLCLLQGASVGHCRRALRPEGSGCRELRDPFSFPWRLHFPGNSPPEQIPNTVASRELDEGNTKIICMLGTGHTPSHPFTQAECARGLGPKKPSASTTSFTEWKGNNNQLNESRGNKRGFLPLPCCSHYANYKIIHQLI